MKVFLSSTYLDLIEHRKVVVQGLRTMGEDVEHMEIFGARNEEPTKASLEELDGCHVLVGIYAYRYGTVPKGSKTSVTEQEYLHATSKKMPILVFIVNEDYDWPPKKMDEKLTKIKKFKAKASSDHTPAYFTTPDNLATQVVAAIGKLAKKAKTKKRPKSSVKSSMRREAHLRAAMKGVRDDVRGSTLPNQPYFFGREKELEIIADAISPESRTWGALIDGPGGIGKTALAIKAARDSSKKLFERKIFITAKVRELTPEGEKPLKDFSRDNYFSMLNELALELGEEEIPRLAPDERANQLRMAMAGKKGLIVFDNLETLPEDERTRLFQFLSRLPEGNKAIVTSRRRADVDARVIRLDRLLAGEALQLMEELAKNNPRLTRENKEARYELYEITNGNPLLIKWVCGQLGREGSAMYTIAEACTFIQNAPRGNNPLEYIFGDLLETFTESEIKVLAALTHFTQPAKLMWLAETAGLAEGAAETALEDLTDRSILISNDEFQEFFLPSLAAQFIRKERPEAVGTTGGNLAIRANELVLQYLEDENFKKFIVMETEWPFIFASFQYFLAGDNTYLQVFCTIIDGFLESTGRWDESILLNTLAEKKALESKDYIAAGWRVNTLAFYFYVQERIVDFKKCVEKVEKYWRKAGTSERAYLYRLRGMLNMLQENYKLAIKEYSKALELARDLDSKGNAISTFLNELADAEQKINNLQAAKKYYKEAIRIAKKNNDSLSIAGYTANLASLAIGQEKWKEAEDLAVSVLKLAEMEGEIFLVGFINFQIAISILNQDRPKEALPYSRRTVDIYTRLRHPSLEYAKHILVQCEKSNQSKRKKNL